MTTVYMSKVQKEEIRNQSAKEGKLISGGKDFIKIR